MGDQLPQVNYLAESDILDAQRGDPPPYYSATGYGRKIPTQWRVQLTDKIWRRVYVCQYSNAGTAYVLKAKEWLVVDCAAEDKIKELAAKHE
jgi:hypothetical protein